MGKPTNFLCWQNLINFDEIVEVFPILKLAPSHLSLAKPNTNVSKWQNNGDFTYKFDKNYSHRRQALRRAV